MPGRSIVRFLAACALLAVPAPPSAGALDLDAYSQYLTTTRDWGSNELLGSREPFGPYRYGVSGWAGDPAYLSDLDRWLLLTPGEREILGRHGFVVSERWRSDSFGNAFMAIHARDLPVFVSTDAILHAVHKSYDDLLIAAETGYVMNELAEALASMRAGWPRLNQRYQPDERMRSSLADVDVYLTVAEDLLNPRWQVHSQSGSDELVRQILNMVANESPAMITLFSASPRTYDFSQMKPRGHYVGDEHPELADYFRAMMWLGRTELRLSPTVEEQDVSREIIDARLLLELARDSGARRPLDDIDRLLSTLVGPPDNVTMVGMDSLFVRIGVESADVLLDPAKMKAFRAELDSGAYTQQAILSQILYADLLHPEQLQPPFAFLLLGQRFLIDSFVTGDVVWPAVPVEDPDVDPRFLPDPLDVLYSLGNDDVLPFLKEEIDRYRYAPNLAAVRYLVDDQDPPFWQGQLYNAWLQAIRTLSMSGRQEGAPAFMRTGAWQQEKMNTQLAAWAELRHDNLLYAKQSYTGGISCSFPCTYIEPVPEFYMALGCFAEIAAETFALVPNRYSNTTGFFRNMKQVMDRLEAISQKELHGGDFTEDERRFLASVIYTPDQPCEESGDGWYRMLYYLSWTDASNTAQARDALVADVHTDPNTRSVLHVATGEPELGIFVAPGENDRPTAFVGPVAAYHEYVTNGFLRLTDDEWNDIYESGAPTRPDWTYVYLADRLGNFREDGRKLPTIPDSVTTPQGGEVHTVEDPDEQAPGNTQAIAHFAVTPNPIADEALISFRVGGRGVEPVRLGIYDAQGRLVRELLEGARAGSFINVRWFGDDGAGRRLPPGAYYARLQVGTHEATRKLLLVH